MRSLPDFAAWLRQEQLPSSADFRAICLPMLKEVAKANAEGELYFKHNIDSVIETDLKLRLEVGARLSIPMTSDQPLFKKPETSAHLKIDQDVGYEVDTATGERFGMLVKEQTDDLVLTRPAFLTRYDCWEEVQGHYDPLTEIYRCGLILASVAFATDLSSKEGMAYFVSNRKALYRLNKELHPSLLHLIREMTELYREDRIQSLEEVILRLEEYATFDPDLTTDLSQLKSTVDEATLSRDAFILDKLKSRLYDVSRRNRLIYFKEQRSFVDLTVSSVPVQLDYRNIAHDSLFYWHDKVKNAIKAQKPIDLSKYLQLKDTPYLVPRINRARLDARKSVNEFGFSQLRLVVAFLHWFNFKDNKAEKIVSPLLLLPISLSKKKGLSDRFVLTPEETELEVNPVLSHYLYDLFGIKLPERLDLDEHTVEEFIDLIRMQLEESKVGVSLKHRAVPEISLIHARAKKTYSVNIKKAARRAARFHLGDYSYSYDSKDFRPLGLEIFKARVKYRNTGLEYLINEDLSPDEHSFSAQKDRSMYSISNRGTDDPYTWEVDTCSLTIGNFSYQKMSLVKDYERIAEEDLDSKAFEDLFDAEPKVMSAPEKVQRSIEDDFSIVAADPTQRGAVALAATGSNYIIQGPPGTGKSQTITNLVAHYIAEGKKVLFVCEKRAALDVVFHRLKQKGLDELCCLVHDSQSDKKAFIMDLKETYEALGKKERSRSRLAGDRAAMVASLSRSTELLRTYHRFMSRPIAGGDQVSAVQLLQVVAAYRGSIAYAPRLNAPSYLDVYRHQERLAQWITDHAQGAYGRFLKDYPLIALSDDWASGEAPAERVENALPMLTTSAELLSELIDESVMPPENYRDMGAIRQWLILLERIKPVMRGVGIRLLDKSFSAHDDLKASLRNIDKMEAQLASAQDKNAHWKVPLDLTETKSALAQWNKYERNFLKLLFPGYHRLKKKLRSLIDFTSFSFEPDLGILLDDLLAMRDLEEQIAIQEQQLAALVGVSAGRSEAQWIVDMDRDSRQDIEAIFAAGAEVEVDLWLGELEQLLPLAYDLFAIDSRAGQVTLPELDTELKAWGRAALSLSTHLPYLRESRIWSEELMHCIHTQAWSLDDLAYVAAEHSLRRHLETNAQMRSADVHALLHAAREVGQGLSGLYNLNVDYIKSSIREEFARRIALSDGSVKGLSTADRDKRSKYRSARKILENEFGKTMRYKSIRELSSGEARHMLIDLKPVWLMSPLSVSDVLALDTDLFDVVIFDEASQITLEEGLPALFRSKQTIIVGDEMQMPPTNFFSSSERSVDEQEEEEAERIGFNLDADSLLDQGARKLESVMLGWHYRSRHESLIGFCNAAFYDRSLLTVPDVRHHAEGFRPMEELILEVKNQSPTDLDAILDRSISYHHLPEAIYHARTNTAEANYIARLVHDLLKGRPELTIGVVAFSMQQQSAIEEALDDLAQHDSEFDRLLEQEYTREEDDQMVGLFVKNLENVQGDERDVIIMSVCYGPNENGKMMMRFGPINHRGGEKRLNVIFSRAKRHMMVVSSIEGHQITNEYNEGALYFRRFLEYAKSISDGRIDDAVAVVQSMATKSAGVRSTALPVITQLKTALEAKGYHCETAIGQSRFKVHLAIKQQGERNYRLGVVIDDEHHYDNADVIEQYSQRPAVLKAFGWSLYPLYQKDWYSRREQVIKEITALLDGQEMTSGEKMPIETPALQPEVSEKDHVPETEDKPIETVTEADLKSTTEPSGLAFERLEYSEGSSNKFWEVAADDKEVVIRFGRIGTAGQTRRRSAESHEKALQLLQELKKKKVAKGYKEVAN